LHQRLILIIADLLVIVHFGFILFVIFGGLLVLKYRKLIWLHLPALIWGVLIEFAGWLCPLTVYENELRSAKGGTYANSFIEHYIIPIIYPPDLNRQIQMTLGFLLVIFNIWVYRKIVKERTNKS
jgi:hypothetical protein